MTTIEHLDPGQLPQSPMDIQKYIGIKACSFTVTVELEYLFDPQRDADSQHIINEAYRYLMGEISQQPALKPLTDSYEDINDRTRTLLKDPAFKAGFGNMNRFLKGLSSAIKDSSALNPSSGGAVTNAFVVGGIRFDRTRYQASFLKDPRCLEIAQDAVIDFKGKHSITEEGAKMGLGNLFAYYIFYEAGINFTEPFLDKLIAAKPK